jgi:serine/threonine protein kinase
MKFLSIHLTRHGLLQTFFAFIKFLNSCSGYLAPEFFSGQVSKKLDIYSLGVVIAEMLTGQQGHCPVENVSLCHHAKIMCSNNYVMF